MTGMTATRPSRLHTYHRGGFPPSVARITARALATTVAEEARTNPTPSYTFPPPRIFSVIDRSSELQEVVIYRPIATQSSRDAIPETILAKAIEYGLRHPEEISATGGTTIGIWNSIRVEVVGRTRLDVTILGHSQFLARLSGAEEILEAQQAAIKNLELKVAATEAALSEALSKSAHRDRIIRTTVASLIEYVNHDLRNLMTGPTAAMQVYIRSREKMGDQDERLQKAKNRLNTMQVAITIFLTDLLNAVLDGHFPLNEIEANQIKARVKELYELASVKAENPEAAFQFWLKSSRAPVAITTVIALDDRPGNLTIIKHEFEEKKQVLIFEHQAPFFERVEALREEIKVGRVGIFLDHDMEPEATGIEVARRLREMFPSHPLPLVLNSYRGREIESDAQAWFDGRVPKSAGQYTTYLDKLIARWNTPS